MSKFNTTKTRTSVSSPVTTEAAPSTVTHEGGPGYIRDAKSELFLLAVSNMVGEDTFYEAAGPRDERYRALIHQVAVEDPDWMARFLVWLRGEANMRSAPVVGALEAARALLKAAVPGARQIVASVLRRGDEPGEALAYWTSRYGRAIPKPVKRGIADAVGRLYTEYNLLKYDTDSKGFRFADVLDLVHPSPVAPWQGDLFRHALDRRHGRDNEVPAELPMLTANALLRAVAATDPAALLDADRLREAGMTWEDVLSLAGAKLPKDKLWESVIPSMGYMALLRNLRNFDQAGVADEVAEQVSARLADPEQVGKSRQLPMRFLSAYRAAPSLRWAHPLDKALTASLANVPTLPGRTLILIDLSGSMYTAMSGRSELMRSDAAKVFGAALALRTDATLVAFDTGSERVNVPKAGALLKLVESFPRLGGGTYTAAAVQRWYAGHDRVVIVTDEQAHFGSPADHVPEHVPLYVWNLAGYRAGNTASGSGTRHTFGGLSDAAFRMVPLLEAGRNADWPF